MSDAPDRLSPELEAFLAPERKRPDPPPEVQNEVFSSVGATLGWFGGGPGPGTGPGPGGSDPSGGAAPGGHATGSLAAHGARHLAKGALLKTVATLVVGGVIGSGVHEAYDRATDRRAAHAKVALVAPPAAPAPPAPTAAPPAAEPQPERAAANVARPENPRPRSEHVARTEVRERDRNLAAERALIEQARTALAREQGAAALAVLERHARDFPEGELAEERESLQVQALVGLERFEQARKLAAHFHRRFPRSIFGAVVDGALKSIP
jgi:pyruvate/2-oxoglutarate dehydrogenase complex dihydrolipoamide acyltransferase (E2) component